MYLYFLQSSLNFEKHSENFSWTENRYDVSRRRHNSSDGFDSGIGRPNGGNVLRNNRTHDFFHNLQDVLIAIQSLSVTIFEFILLYCYQIKVILGGKRKMDGVRMAEMVQKT